MILALVQVLPAAAQIDSREGIALQNQILELRQQLQQVQQSGPSPYQQAPYQPPPYQTQQPTAAPAQTGDTAADLVVRVAALEEQVRALQGRVDDLTNQLQRQNDDLTKQLGDLSFKLGQGTPLQGGAPGAGPQDLQPQLTGPTPAPPGKLPPLAAKPPVKRPPEMALREGNAALARRDYATAATAAHEVLATGGPRANDAQMLLARSENGQHNYRQAAADFYDAYNRAPHGPGAPVALLGVANALIALNDQKDACQALAKISAEFPSPPGGVKSGVNSAKKRAACH